MSDATLHLVRVTIQAETPLSVGSADNGPGDVVIVRDANGLPTIPGASLQGRLNHLHRATYEDADMWFGWARGDDGKSARLTFGFGCVHNSANQAVTGIVFPLEKLAADAVLKLLSEEEPVKRDHVKLNGRHVVEGAAKFDRSAAPKGTHFSFEISLWGETANIEKDTEALERIVGLINHPEFRLGGAGARGFGKVKLTAATHRTFCLDGDEKKIAERAEKLRKARAQPPSTHFPPSGNSSAFKPCAPRDDIVTAVLTLQPIGLWRIGAGRIQKEISDPNPPLPTLTDATCGIRSWDGEANPDHGADFRRERKPTQTYGDATPVRESFIQWENDKASVIDAKVASSAPGNLRRTFAIPGSSLRGPLLHRMLFHWNAQRGNVFDAETLLAKCTHQSDQEKRKFLTERREAHERPPPEFTSLLGHAKERTKHVAAQPLAESGCNESRAPENASRILVNDGEVSDLKATIALDHNKIDRFTGGVIAGALYSEEALSGGKITVRIDILPPRKDDHDDAVRRAFVLALRDLCRGRLAIGAKSLGFCTGTVTWSCSKSGSATAQKEKWQNLWMERGTT